MIYNDIQNFKKKEVLDMSAENGAYPPNQNGLIHPQLSLKWA